MQLSERIPDALDGERVDRAVAMLADCSRSKAADLIAGGSVTLDDSAVTTRSTRVATGQIIAIEIDESAEETVLLPDPSIAINVRHVDDHLLVIDKPANLVVHPGAGNPDGTLVNGLLGAYPDLEGVGEPDRPGIVHRLDRGTTGLLIVARTNEAHEALVEALSYREITRIYVAVVFGTVEHDEGTIDAPIGRSSRRRTRMAVTEEGKEARTHYEVMDRSHHEPEMSLVECRLDTGRTHQIRVHLEAIGHAVVGDDLYNGVRGNLDFIAQAPPGGRPALHAHRLVFTHPVTGERIDCTSPIPADMQALISDHF